MKQPRIHAYIRVSTSNGQKLDSQETALQQYASIRGWPSITWHIDKASGAKADRQGLDNLMALVRKGKVDIILSYKIDRLGRSLSHLALIIEELNKYGVALIIPSQGIDTSNDNPAGRLQLNILQAIAEFERSLIQERVKAGLEAAKARGVKLGRRNTTEIYKQDAIELRQQGLSMRKIASELDLSPATVHRLLRN